MKQLENERQVREVAFCGYAQYAMAIKAAEAKLAKEVSTTERKVLEAIRSRAHAQEFPCVSKALLFGEPVRHFPKSDLAALVKLVRRGLINIYLVTATGHNAQGVPNGGLRHLWEVTEAA